MSKAVLISIQPKWCELIASGKKTIEVRKTKPKLDTPFKCYIYCTKPSKKHQTICGGMVLNDDELYRHPKQGIKYGDSIELMCCNGGEYSKDNFLNGKVIGEFVCDEIIDYKLADVSTDVGIFYYYERYITKKLYAVNSLEDCLTDDELLEYGNYKSLYGWHITDLKIYDEPKELSEFKHICIGDCDICKYCKLDVFSCIYEPRQICDNEVKRPPQSWCYVEELRDV